MEPRHYLTGLLCLTTFFLFADQNCLSPNMTAVAKEFNFSADEKDSKLGGEIALGFFLIGGVVSVMVGALADTVNRCKLFMYIVVLGEISCIGTYMVTTYEQLLFCRILTGISIGGCAPIVYSILGDCFPGSSRVYVTTLMGLSMSAGICFGQLLAGIIGPIYGWRSPFIIIAVPAILCGILVFLTATEPRRGGMKDAIKGDYEAGQPSSASRDAAETGDVDMSSHAHPGLESFQLSKIIDLLRTPTVALCYLQGIPGCIPWSIITVFMSDYLSTDRGLSIKQATFCFTLFGIGGFFGQLSGGWIGQFLYNRDKRLQCLFMGGTTLTAIVPMLSILTTDFYPEGSGSAAVDQNTPVALTFGFMLCVVFTGFVAAIGGPNVRSVLQVTRLYTMLF
jgi:MFS family permease